MSISEQWEKCLKAWMDGENRRNLSPYWKARLRESFFAGARAALQEQKQSEIKTEVEEFFGD